jgi:hypothetical protein
MFSDGKWVLVVYALLIAGLFVMQGACILK